MNVSPKPIGAWLGAIAVAAFAVTSSCTTTSPDEVASVVADPTTPIIGRWALTISNNAANNAGWLEVKRENGALVGSMLWGGGSVLTLSDLTIADGKLTAKRPRGPATKGKAQEILDTVTATAAGDTIAGTLEARGGGKKGNSKTAFAGTRIPPLPPRPNLAKVKFGEPIALFNGRDLTGWRSKDPSLRSAWRVENGALVNAVPKRAPGQEHERTANLRTERDFEDFNLKLEVSVPAESNSGVYLRGIYEIQVFDSYGKPLDPHNMGALYSRITPRVAAEKPAGEWQTLDITLVDRHLTVILNGTNIIDNQPVLGCTGGAMWSDESRPGPIYLQGDHGAVSYRNLVLRPVVK